MLVVICQVLMIANDTKIFRQVSNRQDSVVCVNMQKDVDKII